MYVLNNVSLNNLYVSACYEHDRKHLAPVVQKVDSVTHRINHYPVDNTIGFANAYLLDDYLSAGLRYPRFEQPGPGP